MRCVVVLLLGGLVLRTLLGLGVFSGRSVVEGLFGLVVMGSENEKPLGSCSIGLLMIEVLGTFLVVEG